MRTQTERVVKQLHKRPKTGVTRVDFLAPNVIDGQDPIVNFPGRIHDIENELGIQLERPGRRNGCLVYRLPEAA